MSGMLECWTAMEEMHRLDSTSLRDGMPLLLQAERDSRESRKIARLSKDAKFRVPASLEGLEIGAARGVPQEMVTQLGTGSYIKDGRTVVITGATGTGKTYLANALGQRACRQKFRVSYSTLEKLLDNAKLARLENTEIKFFDKMLKVDLLIIDDWGLKKLQGQQMLDLEQILDDRYNKKATIISSQLPVSGWHDLFDNPLIADACLDRIVHKAIRFELKGESMRKKY